MSIADRFNWQPVASQDALDHVTAIIVNYRNVATLIDATLPDGRMKSLALTELEASFNWAVRAAIELRP